MPWKRLKKTAFEAGLVGASTLRLTIIGWIDLMTLVRSRVKVFGAANEGEAGFAKRL
jgi:hypothetical protein